MFGSHLTDIMLRSYSCYFFLGGGDFNTDLIRSSLHTIALSQFIYDFNMTTSIDLVTADVPNTYAHWPEIYF